MMLVVVPREELLTEAAGLCAGAQAVGEARPGLQGCTGSFRVGVVGGDIGTAGCFGNAEVGQQQGPGFRSHGRAPVGVERPLARRKALFFAAVLEEVFRSVGRFALGDQPAGDRTAEEVQNHSPRREAPFHRTRPLGAVPAPQRMGAGGEPCRLAVGGTTDLIAALPAFAFCGQPPVPGAQGARGWALLEQGSLPRRGRTILTTLLVPTSQPRRFLLLLETARRRTSAVCRGRRSTAWRRPVIRSARKRQFLTGALYAHARAQVLDRLPQQFSLSGISGRRLPNSSATLFGNVNHDFCLA
jgi:hypothetical protein